MNEDEWFETLPGSVQGVQRNQRRHGVQCVLWAVFCKRCRWSSSSFDMRHQHRAAEVHAVLCARRGDPW